MNTEKLAKAEKIYLDSIAAHEASLAKLNSAQGGVEAAQTAKAQAHDKLMEVIGQITK